MRKILLATHGTFAKGILNSLSIIMGEQSNIECLCAYLDGEDCIEQQVKTIVESKDANVDLVVVTDVFGGSVNNEFMKYLDVNGLYLISGLNLNLLLELTTSEETSTDKMIKDILEKRNDFVKYCERKSISDEEF
ncbi:PTS sugar transporter subunit IIA [Anaerocolumna sp. MB42-C2]|uniref:PTS sugar transporter subunit IIA n=1 Tax=Anaerocolumna sp. MB42-C2 TaxID=3070997 RepID=UPI0027E1029A|nr:PTS sugar transporter [Anaerocolumna sp. MB42-C2]WMJ89144.1 PTS sugar transporter [Anaerocolumna sp. MB42-C2]